MLYMTHIDENLSKGYTQCALNYIKALQTQSVNFELFTLMNGVQWANAPWWIQDSADYFAKTQSDRKCILVHLMPSDLCEAPFIALERKADECAIGLTTFETTHLPAWIAETLNSKLDGLIVPSEFNKTALLNSGVTIPIHVVYHALGDWWWKDKPFSEDKDEDVFVYGYVGAWNNRKNPEAVLRAYLQAFPESTGKHALLIKTHGPNAVDSLVKHTIKSVVGEDSREDIWFYNEDWDEDQMLWLFKHIDCYVSAHKGEGFGLGLAQSAVVGKPVIYTGFSAPTEWLGKERGHYPLKFKPKEVDGVDASVNLHFSDSMNKNTLFWAEPDVEDLAHTMFDVFNNKGDISVDTAHIRKALSWDSVGQSLVSAIESVSGRKLQKVTENVT